MEIVFISMFLGMLVGISKRLSEKNVGYLSKLAQYSLFAMLISLGAIIGSDSSLVSKLDILGAKSLLLAFLSMFFGVVILAVALKIFKQGDNL